MFREESRELGALVDGHAPQNVVGEVRCESYQHQRLEARLCYDDEISETHDDVRCLERCHQHDLVVVRQEVGDAVSNQVQEGVNLLGVDFLQYHALDQVE